MNATMDGQHVAAPVCRWASMTNAAAELGVHPDTVRRMIARGEVYAERIGPRLIRVDLNSIQAVPLTPAGGEL